jgi:type IV secretory pathway TrbL component
MSATPKSAARRNPHAAANAAAASAQSAAAGAPGLLDALPVWSDQIATEKEATSEYFYMPAPD